jgi:hypothetical protein
MEKLRQDPVLQLGVKGLDDDDECDNKNVLNVFSDLVLTYLLENQNSIDTRMPKFHLHV